MHIMMGILKLPRVQLYWSTMLDIPIISKSMTRNRFYELRSYLHFVDYNDRKNTDDKLFLIKPIVEQFKQACLDLPRGTTLAVDEQMIPFSGRCGFRQYVPSKPNPVGLKNFVLAAPDGLVLDFVIYTGKNTVPDSDVKELGLGGAVVKKLIETVPPEKPVLLFTDRYFTSLKLLDYLLSRNVYLTGTVMANRTGGVAATLPKDSDMARGTSAQKVRGDQKTCIVKWKDNKSVLLLSSAAGVDPEGTCKRWSRERKMKIDIKQPAVVKLYNENMGGIDLFDRFVSYYRITTRTKKWTIRVFTHFLDMACCNAWIQYTRDCKSAEVATKNRLDLLEFKANVAESLIRGRTYSRDEGECGMSSQQRQVRGRIIPIPPDDIRFDRTDHFPAQMKLPSQKKCRNPGCTGKTRVMCRKCNVFLCLLNKDCFYRFHTK
nr:DDE domain transposase [Nuttalliella namaqua]